MSEDEEEDIATLAKKLGKLQLDVTSIEEAVSGPKYHPEEGLITKFAEQAAKIDRMSEKLDGISKAMNRMVWIFVSAVVGGIVTLIFTLIPK